MSYEEKGVWVYLMVAVATFTAYVVVVLGRAGDGVAVADVPYVSLLLWTVGVSVVLRIIATIVVEILKPSESQRSDERDKRVNRFGEYVGGMVVSALMVGPLVLAMADAPHFWIANAIYAAFVVQALTASVVKLVAYRRGV